LRLGSSSPAHRLRGVTTPPRHRCGRRRHQGLRERKPPLCTRSYAQHPPSAPPAFCCPWPCPRPPPRTGTAHPTTRACPWPDTNPTTCTPPPRHDRSTTPPRRRGPPPVART